MRVLCDQYNCHWHLDGVCQADEVELVEAPGGFWMSCRTKMGIRWEASDGEGMDKTATGH